MGLCRKAAPLFDPRENMHLVNRIKIRSFAPRNEPLSIDEETFTVISVFVCTPSCRSAGNERFRTSEQRRLGYRSTASALEE